jgi:hypothetical protein
MFRSIAWVTLAVAVLVSTSGCSETNVANARPQIEVNPTSLDYGHVSLLTIATDQIVLSNNGTGWLEFESIEVVESSGGSFWPSTEPQAIGSGDEWVLNVSFAPVLEEAANGTLRITSNSVEQAVVDITLGGDGVRPILDVTPTAHHFDTSDGAGTETDTVTLESSGSGPVIVQDVFIEGDDFGAFNVSLPPTVQLPHSLDPGLSIEVDIIHVPEIGESYQAQMHILSNDINDEDQVVQLSASGQGTGGEPPECLITTPNSGFALEVGGAFDLEGLVTDVDQDNNTLVAYLQSDLQGNLGPLFPDAKGNVTLDDIELELGSHTVSLVAIDNENNLCSHPITVLIWEQGQTFDYMISGGASAYHYFAVDDDLAIYLDGDAVFIDNDGQQNLMAPIPITAEPGQTLRIVASDQIACTGILDALVLHLNDNNVQPLNDEFCKSDCEEHQCYDPTYTGPWPNDFLDQQFVIAIP